MAEEVHIGNIIRKTLNDKKISGVALAKQLGRNPSAINLLFRRKDFHATLLKKVSILLKHNFFKYYYDEMNEILGITQGDSGTEKDSIQSVQKEIEEIKKEITELREIVKSLKKK